MTRFELFDLEKSTARAGRVNWQQIMQLSARVTRLRSRPTLRRGNDVVVMTHRVRMRRVDALAPGMRLRQSQSQSQRVLIIHDVETTGRRQGWLSCLCEEQKSLTPNLTDQPT